MNENIVISFLVFLVILELLVLFNRVKSDDQNSIKNEDEEKGEKEESKEDFFNYPSYVKLPNWVESNSESCRRCNKNAYENRFNGYQSPPSGNTDGYWFDFRTVNDDRTPSKNWRNYRQISTPVLDTHYTQCTDDYRCRKFGVATGVQGKIM